MRTLRYSMATRNISAAALLLALLAGCGSDKQQDSLDGPIGPGVGGQSVGATVSQTLTKPDGSSIGTMSYDNTFFTLTVGPSDPVLFGTLVSGANNITITMTHISGRVDTPCRFNAAILARDQGYGIAETGFRTNQNGQELYQVNFTSGPLAARLFCASLLDNVGLQYMITADIPAKITWLEVYAVLNSIQP